MTRILVPTYESVHNTRFALLARLSFALLALAASTSQGLFAQSDWQFGYEDGFYARSADGRNELVLEGLFQTELRLIPSGRGRISEFAVRRMRPELAGKFDDAYRFRFEPKFQDDGVELEEAWIGVDLAQHTMRLMLGRMKAPFNLEEVKSRRHINFSRFSILNQFAPAEDVGVFLNGKSASGIEYGLAAYNGTGGSDTTSSKDVAARIALHPEVAPGEPHTLVGLAATWGRQDTSIAGESIVNAFDSAVMDYSTGTRLHGQRLRVGAEFAWYSGPILLQAELLWVRQEMSRMNLVEDVDFYGAYAEASIVLTGEERRGWSGVAPESEVDPLAMRGSGAWILAMRASELMADKALRSRGFAVPGRYTEHVRSVSLGLNWVLNRHLIVRHAYVHSFYSDDVLLGGHGRSHEGALMIEWQLHF